MNLSDNAQSFSPRVDISPAALREADLRQAQRELERANRALKQARSTQAAAAKVIDAAVVAHGETYSTVRLAESRVNDCQKRLYELS